MSDLAKTIDDAFEKRNDVTPNTKGAVREAVDTALDLLDKGEKRVAEKSGDNWQVNQWLKKAVLLSFRLNDMGPIAGAPAAPAGGTRCRRNSRAGARTASAPQASAPCLERSCAARPISRRTWC